MQEDLREDATSFLLFYDEDQVNQFQQLTTLNDIERIMLKMERPYDFEEYRKRLVLMTSINYES
jgi:hypothetical protein